jgi:hypothetical protein
MTLHLQANVRWLLAIVTTRSTHSANGALKKAVKKKNAYNRINTLPCIRLSSKEWGSAQDKTENIQNSTMHTGAATIF